MLGTAFPADRLLLVEQPGPWGRQGLVQSRFDPATASALLRVAEPAGVRVLAIRRPGRSEERAPRRWAYADCRLGRERLRWGRFAADADLLAAVTALIAGRDAAEVGLSTAERPAYLVCTHGSHDACCALRGRPIAAALHERRPDDTWECSHVGGDRFAANVMALPSGLVYGSVRIDELDALLAVTENGGALSEPLRGKVGLVPEAQAALARAHAAWGGRVSDYRVEEPRPFESGVSAVRVAAGPRSADVLVRVERSPVHRLTCQMTAPATVFIYRAVGFSEV